VHVLACRARATRADAIRAITSLLLRGGHDDGGLSQPGVVNPRAGCSAGAASDPWSLDGLDADRRFVEILTAHAESSLVSAQLEMVEGFSAACRSLAEDASRESWRERAALRVLIAGQANQGSGGRECVSTECAVEP